MPVKSGFVSIIGKPNAGKSTLMNALIGEKLSITNSKPQTTRKKILGILSGESFQIIFLDTPGILNPEYLLQEKMLKYVISSVKDSDLILLILDVNADPNGIQMLNDETVSGILGDNSTRKILILNKIDLSNQEIIETLIKKIDSLRIFNNIIPVSATEKFNLESLTEAITDLLPEHPKYFPDDQLSDANERFFVSEIIREKIFEFYSQEIPYSAEVVIEEFKERENSKDYILASIIVERESQKPIILGKKGDAIKKFLQHEVYLELRVKVREKWRSNPNMLKSFGYTDPDE